MNKPAKVTLLVLGVAIIWSALAALNTGPIGLGVILALLALLDIAMGSFKDNHKLAWLIISLSALLFAFIGIGSVYVIPAETPGKNVVYGLAAGISIILSLAYFILGRRQKTGDGK